MIPILRPKYQVPLVNSIRDSIRKNPTGHFMAQLGTGGGKTYCFSYIGFNSNKNKKRVFIGTDRTELLSQASSSIARFGIKHSFINPKAKAPDFSSPTVIGMAQTILRRYEKPEWRKMLESFDIYILDEAHKQVFNFLFEHGILDDKLTIGWSATPIRSGSMRQLGMDYDEIIQGVSIREMVEMGYLMQDTYYSVDDVDVSKVPFNPITGDLRSSAMYNIFNNREKYIGVVGNYKEIANDTKALCFSVNVAHCIKTAAEFQKSGIPSLFLVSNINEPKKPLEWKNDAQRMKYDEDRETYLTLKQHKHLTGSRKDVLEAFAKNKIKVLHNVDILTTGYDQPDIETVIINRSTISQVLWSQMQGRASRPSPETGKIGFSCIDMGNHVKREVLPLKGYTEPIEFGLWHDKSKGGGVVPVKECPKNKEDRRKNRGCGRLIGVSLSTCPFCFFEFPTKKEEKEVRLREIAYGDKVPEEVLISKMGYLQLKAHAKLKGYKPGWIGRVLYNRGGKDEVYKGMKEMGYKHYFIREYVLKYIER